jgi:acetylornithine deacetylase/succinyl-diaminopimelate desuccinylase-like protein
VTGLHIDLDDEAGLHTAVAKLGPIARVVSATMRNTTHPTMLEAGYKVNVIPQVATARIDGRFLPGYEEEFFDTLDDIIGPDVERVVEQTDIALETRFDGPLLDAIRAALRAEDPAARIVPYCLSGGTDAKSFSRLGIRCYGFSPLRLPPTLDFTAMFHGVDERVPVDALRFGVRVLDRFLDAC